jgi:hypothetical protein
VIIVTVRKAVPVIPRSWHYLAHQVQKRSPVGMDRQVALLMLAPRSMAWSAFGAPPVDRADRKQQSEREAKTDGGSLKGCAVRLNGTCILPGDTLLAWNANLKRMISASEDSPNTQGVEYLFASRSTRAAPHRS